MRITSLDVWICETEQNAPLVDSERYVSYNMTDLYPEWQEHARCKDQGHVKYFGDEDEQPTMSIAAVRRASKLCDACPVFEECLRHALEVREEYGVWAGTSGRARRKLFKKLDNGSTVEEVMEVVRGERRGEEPRAKRSAPAAFPDVLSGRDGVPDEATGDVAL